jgi:hypothetical protein
MVAGERGVHRPKIVAVVADPERRRELSFQLKHNLVAIWDDLTDEKRETLLAYDEMVCARCGNLRSECSDPSVDWHPRLSDCYATAAIDWAWRKLAERYPADAKEPDGSHPRDGLSVWVSQVAPEPGEDEFADLLKGATD